MLWSMVLNAAIRLLQSNSVHNNRTDARICSKHMENKQAELSSLLKRLRETVQANTASPGSIVL
ncbi:hypothetical protein ILYODFUR_034909, partial [Ilyodon furcidens]